MKTRLVLLVIFGGLFFWLNRSAARGASSSSPVSLGVSYYSAGGGQYM